MKAKKTLKKKVEQQIAVPKDTAPVTDNIDVLDAVQLQASVELGRTRLTLDEALNIGEQSLIELDKSVGDAVDVMLNGKLFARGEIVTVAENYGVRLTEVLGEV
ncbi:MAG: FliM/FliN family flagellar motor switch protein [Candidatus Latescibacterota bacterium]|jgi:flagellar motor switch protein FliN/FliY